MRQPALATAAATTTVTVTTTTPPPQADTWRHGAANRRLIRDTAPQRRQAVAMLNTFNRLLQQHPLVFFHLVTALGALVLGVFILARRKGTGSHRALGWCWVALMAGTALASAFIRDYSLPNIAGFTPIHAFTVLVAWQLPMGIRHIRRGQVAAHRKTMRSLYLGACVLAGVFTLLPGRFLGRLLWQQGLGIM